MAKAITKKVAKKKVTKKKVAKTATKRGRGRVKVKQWIVGGSKLNKYQVQAKICYEISHSSLGLETILKLIDGMPKKTLVYEWLQEDEYFADKYAKAKQEQMEYMAMEIVDIADNSTNDYMEKLSETGEEILVPDRENVQRSRLRIDTRKWLMSKLKPQKFGDRVTTAHVTPGADGEDKPVEYVILPVAAKPPE